MKHFLIAAASSLAFALPAAADPIRDATAKELPSLMALYKELHAAPEFSQHEVQTAARMAAEARKAGFTVTEKVGGTGVVAVMKNGVGPTIQIGRAHV